MGAVKTENVLHISTGFFNISKKYAEQLYFMEPSLMVLRWALAPRTGYGWELSTCLSHLGGGESTEDRAVSFILLAGAVERAPERHQPLSGLSV